MLFVPVNMTSFVYRPCKKRNIRAIFFKRSL